MQVNQRSAWYALIMMTGVVVFASTHGYMEWGSALVAALAFWACLISLRVFSPADERFLLRNGMTGDAVVSYARLFNIRPDEDGGTRRR